MRLNSKEAALELFNRLQLSSSSSSSSSSSGMISSSRSKSYALLKVYLSYYDMLVPSSDPNDSNDSRLSAIFSGAYNAEDRIRVALGIAGKDSGNVTNGLSMSDASLLQLMG